jgi:hypothetical protein
VAAFLLVVALPVELLGCRTRGLAAALIALLGALGGLGATGIGVIQKRRNDPRANWWVVSTLILILPAVLILLLA